MSLVLWSVFYMVVPAGILALTRRSPMAAKIGAIVIAYALGLLVGNIGILPERIGEIQTIITSATVPIALPLLFFSFDLRRWRGMARVGVRSLLAALLAVSIGSIVTYLIYGAAIGPEKWKVAGMLVGVYTGGTPNLAAIGNALAVDPVTYVAVHGSDVVASAIVLFFLVGAAPRLYRRILPPFTADAGDDGSDRNFSPHFSGWSRRERKQMATAVLLALGIVAVGASPMVFLPEATALPVSILAITTLGIAASLIERIRNLRNSFQLGYYLILAFSVTVSSMANVRELSVSAPIVLAYVGTLLVIVSVIHLLLSRLLKVDRDTHIVTATSFIFSPPFVPVVAAALGNRRVVLSGIIIGVTGWVIGNYMGFALAYLLRLF